MKNTKRHHPSLRICNIYLQFDTRTQKNKQLFAAQLRSLKRSVQDSMQMKGIGNPSPVLNDIQSEKIDVQLFS